MSFEFNARHVQGLPPKEREILDSLWKTYIANKPKNDLKERYYDGRIPLSTVNLGVALPDGLSRLEIDCGWGTKAVDVLAARSVFDGFVGVNGEDADEVNALAAANNLVAEYKRICRDELKFGCVFAALSKSGKDGCKIRFHSPRNAAARWSGEKNRISAGFAIIDTAPDNTSSSTWTPSLINFHTDDAIWVIRRTKKGWNAEKHPHKMGRPLMEPLIWDATTAKPFGRSRLDSPVRRLIDGYVRTLANATIGLEFATTPQKYLLGVTDAQFEAVTKRKFEQYVGSIITATRNPDVGENPEFGQLSQGNIQPHVEMLRILATQFSAITGLSVMDTGVVNDANPTSSDAIEAQTKSLTHLAELLNGSNGAHLKTIGLMALAISRNTTIEELPADVREIIPRFRNPATPSLASMADAALKIASVRPAFAQTDLFLEMLNFDAATIRRARGQEQRVRGLAVLQELEGGT